MKNRAKQPLADVFDAVVLIYGRENEVVESARMERERMNRKISTFYWIFYKEEVFSFGLYLSNAYSYAHSKYSYSNELISLSGASNS